MAGSDNDDIIKSSQDYIKSRYDFLDQQEKELAKALEQGKNKEKEMADKLLALKKKMEALSEDRIRFDTETEKSKPETVSGQNEINTLELPVNSAESSTEEVKIRDEEKIEETVSQKLVELVDLTEKEEKTIQKKFGDKSLEETEKIVNKEKHNPKMRKIFDKIRKTALILGVTFGLSRTIYQYAVNDAKKRANEKVEKEIKPSPQDSIPTLPARTTITTDTLKKHVRQEQLVP